MTPQELQQRIQKALEAGYTLEEVESYLASKGLPAEQIQSLLAPWRGSEQKGEGGLKGFATGVAKGLIGTGVGVASTLQKLGQLGIAAIDPTHTYEEVRQQTGFRSLNPETPEGQALQQALTPHGTAERIGSFAADVATLAVPGSAIVRGGKAVKALAGGGIKGSLARTATEAAGFAGVEAARSGLDTQQAKEAAQATVATNALLGAGGLALRFLGTAGKTLAKIATYKPDEVIDLIMQRPRQALKVLKLSDEEANAALKELSTNVRTQVAKIQREASEQYKQALQSVPKRFLGKKEIVQTVSPLLKEYRVSVKGGKVQSSPFSDADERALERVLHHIARWKDTSAPGLLTLSQKVESYIRQGEQSEKFNTFLYRLSKTIRDHIVKAYPEVKEMHKEYEQAKDFLTALRRELGITKKVTGTAGVIQTMRRISTLFNKHKELARDLVMRFERERGIDVLGTAAAHSVRGTDVFSSPYVGILYNIIGTVLKPDTVGRIVARFGIAREKVQPFVDFFNNAEPAVKAAIVQMLLDEASRANQSPAAQQPR